MNAARVERLLVQFEKRPAADLDSLKQFERESGLTLPTEYAEFLMLHNGGEGFIGEAYLMLWPIEELFQLNKGYDVAHYAPGLLMFGSDGGGEAFAFDVQTKAIVMIPFIGLEQSDLSPIASTFYQFLEVLSEGKLFGEE